MSSTNSEVNKRKDHELPLPLLIFAVIGLVIIGVLVAFGNKIFKKNSDSATKEELEEMAEMDLQESKEEVVQTDSNEDTPQPEESVFVSPEEIPQQQTEQEIEDRNKVIR